MADTMVEPGTLHPSTHGHLRSQDKFLSLVAWTIAAGLFASVGWMAIEPLDPLGAVSVLTRSGAALMILEVAAMAAIVSGIATALIGKRLPDAGVFAAAMGLAAANLRGATSEYMLISVTGADAAARSALAWKFAVEGFAWFLAVIAAMIVAATVTRWLAGEVIAADDVRPEETSWRELTAVLPLIDPPETQDGASHRLADGLKITGVTLIGSVLLFRILVTGSPWRSVQHGQVYFAIIASVYVASLVAYRMWPARSALWGCLVPPLLCVVGYVICALGSSPRAPYGQLASVPPSAFYRALPVEYISVGTLAAVAAFWSARRHWLAQTHTDISRSK